MLRLLKKIMDTGTVTENYAAGSTPPRFRGEVLVDVQRCTGCLHCMRSCPVGAITPNPEAGGATLPVIHSRLCVWCGQCVETCEQRALAHSAHYQTACRNSQAIEAPTEALKRKIRRTLRRSLHIRHVDAGSCNACEFEMAALNNPIYDLQQYGIDFVPSPRHADMLMVTGVVTRNLKQALLLTYEAVPAPKLVVAVGACAAGGQTFGASYATQGRVDQWLPVDVYIPGCPPRPAAMIYGLLLALDRL